jgi:hypothetical protein
LSPNFNLKITETITCFTNQVVMVIWGQRWLRFYPLWCSYGNDTCRTTLANAHERGVNVYLAYYHLYSTTDK